MAKISPKDNFLKIAYGGMPEYIPYFTMMGEPYLGEAATKMMNPNIFNETHFVDGGKDMWGVTYRAAEGTNNATMPDTSIILLHDIEDWEKVVKFPEVPDIDFEMQYQKDLQFFQVDREQSAVMSGPGLMPFQTLVGLMGFAGGLMALYEDPDSVSDMLNAMVDFLEPLYTKYIDIYKPDIWYMLDDTCAKTAPFFSVETYRQVFKPVYDRMAKPARERGIPIMFHNCGYVEPFIQDMVDFGVSILEPMQNSNDLMKVKEQYKGKLGLIGGADWALVMPKNYPEYDEEELRQKVRDIIDLNAPGGGYGIYIWPLSYFGDPVIKEVNRILRDECHWYGRKVYGYTED